MSAAFAPPLTGDGRKPSDRCADEPPNPPHSPLITLLTSLVVLFSLSYTLALFVASRRRRNRPPKAPDGLWFVFMLPCLDEELVIGKSLDRLLTVPGRNFAILVIDDGSTDRT